HYECIDKALLMVAEHTRKRAYDLESELMPKTQRGLVVGHHEVELHSAKSQSACLAQRMLTHSAADAKAPSSRRNHERRVGDMRTKAGLVGPQDIGADDIVFALRDVAPIRRLQPIR